MRGVLSTRVEIHFVSSLSWDGFGQHNLRCILCPRCHVMSLVNTSWDKCCVLSDLEELFQHELRYILCPRWYGMGLVNTCCNGLSALASMVVFGQHMLRYILCYPWHMRCLRNTCWDAFCVLVFMGWVWSSHVELLFAFSLAKDGFEFDHHM